MAALVRVSITDPQNILDTYGTGALYRIERGSSSAMSDASEITAAEVSNDGTEYEYRDQTGVAGTHWYRLRYSKASPSVASDYSGYGAVFQAGALSGEVITLETFKTWADIDDTVDDPWLPLAIGSCNRAIIGPSGVGLDLGPSPDTTRTYDASAAVRNGTRLYIPGGIRSFTTVEVSTDEATWTAVTSDVRIGPASHERPPGEPGSYIEFKPYTASYSTFAGYHYIRITGTAFATFGWDAWPMDLVQAAVAATKRMMQDRQGRSEFPNETNALRYIDKALLMSYRARYFPAIR